MIKCNTDKHSVSWLLRQSEKELLDFTISIQRKEVWDEARKSNFIVALIIGIPIESLMFEEEPEGEEGYKVLDGKQRSLDLIRFTRNEFALSGKMKIKKVFGVDLVGKTFDELPYEMRERILEYELTFSILRPLTEEERELVFFMRNQAMPLTKLELIKVVAGDVVMSYLNSLCVHPFMLDKISITDNARRKNQDWQILMECMILEMNKDLSFSGNDLTTFATELRENGIPQEEKDKLSSTLDYMDKAMPEKKVRLLKTHIPMVYAIAREAIENNIAPDKFNECIDKFFTFIKKHKMNDYSLCCSSSADSKAYINKRLNFIKKFYNENI